MGRNNRALVGSIAAATLATLVTGSVTAVQAAGTPHPVSACANSKHALVIPVKGKCPAGSKPISLSQQGPQGVQGIQGVPGVQGVPGNKGDTGATGPSDMWVNRIVPGGPEVTQAVPHTGSVTGLMPITIPAGTYLMTVTAELNPGSESDADIYCLVAWSGASAGFVGVNLDAHLVGADNYQSAAFQGVLTTTGSATVSVTCGTNAGNPGGTAGIYSAVSTLVRVGTNHGAGS